MALGVVQGLTEFLPISSSGHLVLAQELFPAGNHRSLAFNICLHFGTLIAVVGYFRHDLLRIAAAAIGWRTPEGERYLGRWVWLLALATVPVAVVGIAFAERVEHAFSSVPAVGTALLVTALLLAFGSSQVSREGRGAEKLGVRDALMVGIFQAFAILPGVSRSGATIVGGVTSGLDPQTAARFAFLLSVPAILAAMVGNLPAVGLLLAEDPLAVVSGMVAAAVTGFLAIELMMRAVKVGRLLPFALYCGVLGLVALSTEWL